MLSLVGRVVAVPTVELCPCDPNAALVSPLTQAQLEPRMTAQAWNLKTEEPKNYESEANLGYIVRPCLQKAWLYSYKTLFTRTVVGQTWPPERCPPKEMATPSPCFQTTEHCIVGLSHGCQRGVSGEGLLAN